MPFAFQSLDIYQMAKSLSVICYKKTAGFPNSEKFALTSQINRAAVSVPANIVEGYSRKTAKDKCHFLNIAYGSLMELLCEFEISKELGYITEEELSALSTHVELLAIKISVFSRKLEGYEK